ncbi:hypothetical protein NLJ89_g5458 [Agrocybe chaxingu]|uniref:DUF1996 domain-containing protein n=1 Tax=Agrocybe chaxingu TaxID=84603 RepID=A0A9W8MWX1_9AGAR|nr:hypothetical protein NLJ89_g5458 [Agrocybe chaxingu]
MLVASSADALLRFSCSQLVIERFDPFLLICIRLSEESVHYTSSLPLANYFCTSPANNQDAFSVTMAPSNDLPKISRCTTCTFKEDFSNYWTAVLYFQHANGSFKRVPQMPGQYLGNPNGGMSIYYIQPTNGQRVTAFKKGFRMIVGDAMVRSMNTSSPEATSLNFRCLDANYGNGGVVGAPGTDSNALPAKLCAGGICSQIVFPTCWEGVNLDSADHKIQVAYSTNGGCPFIHPVVLPQLFIETMRDTRQFNSTWPSNGRQPFVYSMGDLVGVAQHADYVFGWDELPSPQEAD